MMTENDYSIEARLARAHLVIVNAKGHKVISEAIARYNYDEVRLNEGLEMHNGAYKLHRQRQSALGAQYLATEVFHKKLKACQKQYTEHLALARLALGHDPSAVQMLVLKGQRKRTIVGWMEDTRQFYTNALAEPKVIDALSRYNVSREDIEQGRTLLEELEEAAADQERKKGLAQKATKDRNAALKKLEKWVAELIKICRIALGKKSQLLESLDIHVPS
jgi:hypothetical protein